MEARGGFIIARAFTLSIIARTALVKGCITNEGFGAQNKRNLITNPKLKFSHCFRFFGLPPWPLSQLPYNIS